MKKEYLKFIKIYIIGIVLVFLMFLLGNRSVYTHITMNYAFDPTGDAYVSIYDEAEVLSECEVIDGAAELFYWGDCFSGLRPIHYDSHEELLIENIEIRVHGHLVRNLLPEDIIRFFTPNEGIEYWRIRENGLEIKTQNDEPAFYPTESLLKEIKQIADFMSVMNLVFYFLVYTLAFWYLFRVLDIYHDRSFGNLLDVLLGFVGIAAMLMAWNIAFASPYGGTVHPDEMQTRAAVDYYRTHWIQPDVRSEFVAGTVSGYGMTRLSEINLYYLFAGKFANLCVFEMSFRALSMLMILILTWFVLRNVKKERYVAVLFFMTPQLWYLFSYATSDAYDYLFTVFATYEVLASGSTFNRILRESFQKRHIPAYVGMSFIFANLLMAKKTFYVVLVTVFMLLLYRLIFEKKEARKQLLIKYVSLLLISFAIVLVRYAPDFGYYGLQKGAAVDQVIETTALYEYKPSTPAELQAKSTLLYEKGVTLREFFTDWNFNKELFKNYFGYYGVYSLEAREWYYALMTKLYLALFLAIGILVHKNMKIKKGAGECVTVQRLTYWTMWAMIGFMYLLTIYNAYFVDFQPQGRYLFPALPALACQMALYPEVKEHKAVRTLITVIALLSLYSFYKIAYLNF